ncbi:hypothetical protein ACJX0J_027013, partial [Zea mays]
YFPVPFLYVQHNVYYIVYILRLNLIQHIKRFKCLIPLFKCGLSMIAQISKKTSWGYISQFFVKFPSVLKLIVLLNFISLGSILDKHKWVPAYLTSFFFAELSLTHRFKSFSKYFYKFAFSGLGGETTCLILKKRINDPSLEDVRHVLNPRKESRWIGLIQA